MRPSHFQHPGLGFPGLGFGFGFATFPHPLSLAFGFLSSHKCRRGISL